MTKEQKRAAENLRDSELIRNHQQGDAKAFPQLINLYQKVIFWLIFKKLNNRQDAEEVTLDVFMFLLNAINSGKYQEKGNFGGWLHQTALYKANNFLRKRTLITEHPEELPELPIELTESEEESEEILKRFRKFFNTLTLREKRLLVFRHRKNLDWNIIGKRVNLTAKCASWLHSKIIAKFKNTLPKNIF